MYDDRTNLSQQVTENLKSFFADKRLQTTISAEYSASRKRRATENRFSFTISDRRVREAYTALATELLKRNGIASPKAACAAEIGCRGEGWAEVLPYNK